MISLEILNEYEEFTKVSSKRPARLYSFNEEIIKSQTGFVVGN